MRRAGAEPPAFIGHSIEVLFGEHEAFAAEVQRQLDSTGFEYVRHASVGGLEFDFAVYAPGREAVAVLELKSLVGNHDQVANRATALALEAREASGADVVFLVTPRRVDLPPAAAEAGLRAVTVDELGGVLEATFKRPVAHGQAAAAILSAADTPTLFAAMPFSSDYDDTYFVAIRRAAEALRLSARRVDQEDYVGDVVARIRAAIASSRLVVADLSEQRANVMYEVGLADGLSIPVVHISRGTAADLPFDLAHQNTLFYEAGRTTQLIPRLTDRIRAALAST